MDPTWPLPVKTTWLAAVWTTLVIWSDTMSKPALLSWYLIRPLGGLVESLKLFSTSRLKLSCLPSIAPAPVTFTTLPVPCPPPPGPPPGFPGEHETLYCVPPRVLSPLAAVGPEVNVEPRNPTSTEPAPIGEWPEGMSWFNF